MRKLLTFIYFFSTLSLVFAQQPDSLATHPLIGTGTIQEQRLDGGSTHLNDCEKQSTYIFTTDEIIENYYKNYKGNCVMLNTNKDKYTLQGNRIIRRDEPELNNTFYIRDNILTLTFSGKDEDGNKHIANIILKKTNP